MIHLKRLGMGMLLAGGFVLLGVGAYKLLIFQYFPFVLAGLLLLAVLYCLGAMVLDGLFNI
jgi:hypothetical protein